MRKFTYILLLSFYALLGQSQTTAYLKVADRGNAEKIEKILNGEGYIALAYDSITRVQIIRYSENFNMQWKYTITDTLLMVSNPRIVEANDGNFYFMMNSEEHDYSTSIMKFSSAGVLLWQKNYFLASGYADAHALSKAIAGDNGFLFGGGTCSLKNYIVKCSADGTIEWQHQYYYENLTAVNSAYSIIPDGEEYVVSSGGYYFYTLLTMKISSNGALNSYTVYNYPGVDMVPKRIVKLKCTGGYAIMGDIFNTSADSTAFVAIYNQSLNLLSFNRLITTNTQLALHDITAFNSGKNIIVNGSLFDSTRHKIVMINLSNNGTIAWHKRSNPYFTSPYNYVEFQGLTENGNTTVHFGDGSPDGRVIAVVDSNGNGLCNYIDFALTLDHPTLIQLSHTIFLPGCTVQKADVNYTYNNLASFNKHVYCGGIPDFNENVKYSEIGITLSPNPTSEYCTITFDAAKMTKHSFITIFDTSGQIVSRFQPEPNSSSKEIDLRNFDKGVYMIQISSEQKIIGNAKLIVMR